MTENELLPKKRPLMGLLMADNFRESILMGDKTITIREGWRDYHAGDKVLIGCAPDWCVMAKVTRVDFYNLEDVPNADLAADGFVDHEDAVNGLSAYYQNITMQSPVTVIRWQLE